MDAIKVARSSWRRPSSAKTTEEGQRQLHEQAASAEENGPDGGSVRGGQVCPRHRGGLLAARPSGKRRGREAAKARRVRRRRGRGRGKHGIKGQYTTTRPHRLTVVHRGHLIGPKPDNRCSAWAVCCTLGCVFPGSPAWDVHGWDRERLGLKTEEVCHIYRSKWTNGPGSATAVGTRVASWCS